MRRYYCTFFDRNYLIRGLALIDSLGCHERQPHTVFIICLDELTRIVLTRLALPQVVIIPLHKVEARNAALLAAKCNRSHMEYCWTLTSSVISWLLDAYPGVELLTYLDADLFFFSSTEPLFQELGEDSVLIHGHRYSARMRDYLASQCGVPDADESYGAYNVGLLCFRNDRNGRYVAHWWRDRCVEWCYQHLEAGKYGDQRYLNDWCELFPGVHVLNSIGGGVAPWNIDSYSLSARSGVVSVDDVPIIFYHFHSLKVFPHNIVVPAWYPQYNPVSPSLLNCCVIPYVKELFRMHGLVRPFLPHYQWGMVDDVALPRGKTLVCSMETLLCLKQMLDSEGREYCETILCEPSLGAIFCQE